MLHCIVEHIPERDGEKACVGAVSVSKEGDVIVRDSAELVEKYEQGKSTVRKE